MLKRLLVLAVFAIVAFTADDAYAIQYPNPCQTCKFTIIPVLQMPHFFCDYPERNSWGYTDCQVGFLSLSCDTGFELCYYIEISPT